jgi:hypothetical protein
MSSDPAAFLKDWETTNGLIGPKTFRPKRVPDYHSCAVLGVHGFVSCIYAVSRLSYLGTLPAVGKAPKQLFGLFDSSRAHC